MAYIHSFVKPWLEYLGNRIYINNNEPFAVNLERVRDRFEISPLKTYIRLGENLIDEDQDEIIEIPYRDMQQKFGLTIYRIAAENRGWRKAQRYILIIQRKKPGIPNELPETTFRTRGTRSAALKIEWNRARQCVRGVGEDFGTMDGNKGPKDITPWVFYGKKKKAPPKRMVFHDSYDDISEGLFNTWRGKQIKRDERLYIKELPVMVTEEGYLLCLPYDPDLVPKVLMIGKTGKGKSFTMNSILGRAFYVFQDRVGIINDSLSQFEDLMLKNDSLGLSKDMLRVGNEPKNLPVINLYMSCPRVNIAYQDEQIGYRLVISFYDFLNRYKFFTQSVPKWDLGKPEKYLTKKVKAALCKCKTIDEVKETLYDVLPLARDEKKGEGIRSMIFKWLAAIESVFGDEFTDNLFQEEEYTAAEWVLKTRDGKELRGHPFIISMYAGIIPIINNSIAKSRAITKKQIVDLLKRISEWQTIQGKHKKRIWVGFDELKDLLGKKGDELYKALDDLFTQGRFPLIGFIGNIQEYTKLSPSMRANTSHLIIFQLQTREERKAIVDDYNLDKERLETMLNLKTFQCIFATKEKVVLYDRDGRRKVEEGALYRGKILPPLTIHKKPSGG